MRNQQLLRSDDRRPGAILVLMVIMLTALIGMLGLVIDGGLMMASHRQTQNAADSASMVAALYLHQGRTATDARAAAVALVRDQFGITETPTINIPPATGPHAGDSRYAEAIVGKPHTTYLIQLVGVDSNQHITSRAVAGYEPTTIGVGANVLDPYARPGLAVSGGASLVSNGSVIVNSQAAGLDQYGQPVDWGLQKYAMTTSNNSTFKARLIQVRGGVDIVDNYQNFDDGGPSPLFCRTTLSPDLLRDVPTPTQNNVSSITNWNRQAPVTVRNNETRSFSPGVYTDIQINQGADVTFNPGVYILSPTSPNQGIRANGRNTIRGNGVMFYMTGSNYLDVSPGYWDALDDAQNSLDGPLPPTNGSPTLPSAPDPNFNQVRFATLDINTTNADVALTGLSDSSSPYNGMLFFQRRRNTTSPQFQGQAGGDVHLAGTIYAKWANFRLAGGARFDSQFVVGSMSISGHAEIKINSGSDNSQLAKQVFLVE